MYSLFFFAHGYTQSVSTQHNEFFTEHSQQLETMSVDYVDSA